MTAEADQMQRNIELARELYYSGKLGPMGPPPPLSPGAIARRRSSTGSMAITPHSLNMMFDKRTMDILREECNVEIVVPKSDPNKARMGRRGSQISRIPRQSSDKDRTRRKYGFYKTGG